MNKSILIDRFKSVIVGGLGLNINDPNLSGTPNRLTRMYEELFQNVGKKPNKLIKTFPNPGFDEIIMLDNIPFTSMCSHHFLPFQGLAWFLYLPNAALLGASKPARIIQFFSKKPQLQENLSREVMNYVVNEIKPRGAMLVMRAVHCCMSCRGANTGNQAGMTTSHTYGDFRDNPETRAEGLDLIKLSVSLR